MEWPTFLNAPLQRVIRRVSASIFDATIDLASRFATGEEAQLLRDIRNERSRLQTILKVLGRLIVDAESKGYQQAVARWLGQARDAIWDAEDVLDESATDAALLHREWEHKKLQQQVLHDHSAGSAAGHAFSTPAEVWNIVFSDQKLQAYHQLGEVRCRLEDLVENGKLELGLEELAVDPDRDHGSPLQAEESTPARKH